MVYHLSKYYYSFTSIQCIYPVETRKCSISFTKEYFTSNRNQQVFYLFKKEVLYLIGFATVDKVWIMLRKSLFLVKHYLICLHLFQVRIESLTVRNEKKYSLLCLHLHLVRTESLLVRNEKNILCFVYIYFKWGLKVW